MKKVKKQVPAYIPEPDASILARSRKTAYKLDCCLFNFLGIRFGWSSVIGLVPAAGDFFDFALAYRLMRTMDKVDGGLPGNVKIRMAINLLVDFLVGLIPFIGDLADAAVRCNSRNVRLLEEHLDRKYKPDELRQRESKMDPARRPRPATVYEDFSDEEEERRATFESHHDDVRQPTRAYSGRRDRISDEEMGLPRDTHGSRRDERPSRNGTKSSRRH